MDAIEIWLIIAIVAILLALMLLAVAETGLNRISRVKAQAMAESTGTKSARALQQLVEHLSGVLTLDLDAGLLTDAQQRLRAGVLQARCER